MSKEKPVSDDSKSVSVEAIEHFAKELVGYAERLEIVVRNMRSSQFPLIERSSKRNHAILKAIGQFTRGLEGALERMQSDIDSSVARRLAVADTKLPYKPASEKTDNK